MAQKNNARLPDISTLIAAGIDPKTGLPIRMAETGCNLKPNIKKLMRIVDEQNAVNRYSWYNLPDGLDGQLLERILYYKGQGAFFYMEANEKFYFLPYALDGSIDVYGRFTGITPLPFNGSTKDGDKEKPWIQGLHYEPVYGIILPEDLTYDDLTDKCVLLNDYSKQISQTVIPRQQLQDPILDVMSDCIPFMRTALLNSTGVMGMRVSSEDEYSNVEAASRSINAAALDGKKYVPVVGALEFQEMTGDNVGTAEQFLMAMQSLDNFRLSLYGLDNGGIFQKKAHMLQDEQDMVGGNVGLVMQDGLSIRQNFCNIVNSIWGLGIWCEVAETVSGQDKNGDGELSDKQDDKGNTVQTKQEESDVE